MVSSKNIFMNMIWQFLEKIGAKLVSFIVSIILARLLLPEDYGVLAIVLVFVNIFDAFVTHGLGNALIQKKDTDQKDFSTLFYFQLVLAFVLYLILFFLAPIITSFYGEGYEVLTDAIRLLGLNIPLMAMNNVQQSYVSRNMIFKKSFIATFVGTILSAVIGIVLACLNFGVWALIIQSLSSTLFHLIILWFVTRWRPTLEFSWTRLKILFNYGWKLLVAGLLENIYLEIRSMIIGKMYTAEDLAYYNRGEQFPKIISTTVNSSIKSVIFSAISKEQERVDNIKRMTKRSIKTSCYMMFPLMMGLIVTADHLIPLLLTDKWVFCIPYLRIFCLVYMLMPLQTTNMQVLKGIGKSDLYLSLEIVKRLLGVILILVSMSFGPLAIAIAFAASTLINVIISAVPNQKLINYSLGEQLLDITPSALLSLACAVPVWFIGQISLPSIVVLIIQIIVAIAIYILLSILFKVESFDYVKNLILSFFKKKKKS